MDVDDSGSLDFDELRQLGQSVNPRVTRDEAHDMLKRFDTNNNGVVDIDEFVEGMSLLLKNHSGGRPHFRPLSVTFGHSPGGRGWVRARREGQSGGSPALSVTLGRSPGGPGQVRAQSVPRS
eukprot:439751-Pyramimonas_sp.AAC.1